MSQRAGLLSLARNYLRPHLRGPRDAEARIALLLVFALCWCAFLICLRSVWTWNGDYLFLPWNLGLALIPLFLSTTIVRVPNIWVRCTVAMLWLIFLPNAPYILTDLIHLRALDSGPLWLDVLMLCSCGATGLALCYCSLIQVHTLFRRGREPVLGWVVAIGALFLCGFGIYLGRFLRWHSIDLLSSPFAVLADVFERIFFPWIHYRAWAVTLGFGMLLSLGYLLVQALPWSYRTGPAETEA